MVYLRQVGLSLAFLSVATLLVASDAILVFPVSSADPVSAISPDDLSLSGTLAGPIGVVDVLQNGTGSIYYILSNRASQAVTIIDADSLETQGVISLTAGVRDGLLTPDGKYLLLTAGSLVVVDLETNQVTDTVDVGGSAYTLLVNQMSSIAYVVGGTRSKRQIHAVDLETLSVIAESPEQDGLAGMVLVDDESMIVATAESKVAIYSADTLEELAVHAPDGEFTDARVDVIPGESRVLIHGQGRQSSSGSMMFDWESGEGKLILPSSDNLFDAIAVLDSSKTYAILSSDTDVVELDTTAPLTVSVTSLDLGLNAVALGLSPDHQALFVVAEGPHRLFKYDAETLELLDFVVLEDRPNRAEILFVPADLPPVGLSTLNGDHQFGLPGAELEIPLTVRLTNILDQPIPNMDVLFEDLSGLGFEFEPSATVETNDEGLAAVTVRVPTRDALGVPVGDIQELYLSAAAPGVRPEFFDVRVVHSIGLREVSGNHQVVGSLEELPKELVLSATDSSGEPLPEGTQLHSIPNATSCFNVAVVNGSGFATLRCRSDKLPTQLITKQASVIVRALEYEDELGIEASLARFDFTIFRVASGISIENLSGDGQMGESGLPLLAPLQFQILGQSSVALPVLSESSRSSGPPVSLSPPTDMSLVGAINQVVATPGEYAGRTEVEVAVSTPNLPTATYSIEIVAETPAFFIKYNDGQEATIFTSLDLPLFVQVIGESGAAIPFPIVDWQVVQGAASLLSTTTSTGVSTAVALGGLAGEVRVRASIGGLTAGFTINAVGPEPDEISVLSGQGQQLTPGILSDPITVVVLEDDRLAAGAIVSFSGPARLRFYPLGGGDPANPLLTNADLDGEASALTELINIAGITEQGAPQPQTAPAIAATISSGSVSAIVPFGVIGRTPEFSASSITNAATFQVGGLVPGGLVSIFGNGFMEGITQVVEPGGVTSFGGTTVWIDGVKAPLLALAPGALEQVNVQVPFELTPGQLVSVMIDNNGTMMTVDNVAVFLTQPGIFAVPIGDDQTGGAVLHGDDFSLVAIANPADIGEALILFYTGGGGLVDPGVPTGVLGPADPPAVITAQSILRVDGVEAELLFTGYAPGFLGLYQTNFIVPEGIGCGAVSLALELSAIAGPNSVLPINCP